MNNEQNDARAPELADGLARTIEHPIIRHLAEQLTARPVVEATIEADSKLAAVAALIRIAEHDAAELLFIKRALIERDPWSGHVAFPGGRRDPADASLEETAVRETREEVAIDVVKYGRVIGRVDDLAPRSPSLPPIIVRPFVAVVAPTVRFEFDTREVSDAFWVPIRLLRSLESQTEYRLTREGMDARFPAYGVHGHVVWGLTERIVSQLLPLFDGVL